MSLDRRSVLADPALLAALGAHIRTRVPASDADDVLQSVIADALAADGAPDEEGALRRWVFGVARHKVADFYRRGRRERPSDAAEDGPAPSSGRAAAGDLLQWAEKELPPGSDAQRTFEWMLREGEGEKLEAIAASEKLPAPRVRKRVSRMREHFRARWAAYVAGLAAAGLAAFIVFYMLRRKPVPQAHIGPEAPSSVAPPAPSPLELARKERARALEACDRAAAAPAADPATWRACLDGLDRAAAADPAGDADPRVVRARAAAQKALAPPVPSASVAPPAPTLTTTAVPRIVPTSSAVPRTTATAPVRSRSSMSPGSSL
jgi:DNA-directed RNA polymerase specialized sigma24 family protein